MTLMMNEKLYNAMQIVCMCIIRGGIKVRGSAKRGSDVYALATILC